MTNQRIAVFAGTFDPITKGHVDIVSRGAKMFDKVIVAIGVNTKKTTFYPLEQRMQWIKEAFAAYPNVEMDCYEGLTVDYCKKIGSKFLLRGLRNGTDFDYESHIAQLNRALDSEIETVFIMCSPELSYISSTLVRDLILHNGDFKAFLPSEIKIN